MVPILLKNPLVFDKINVKYIIGTLVTEFMSAINKLMKKKQVSQQSLSLSTEKIVLQRFICSAEFKSKINLYYVAGEFFLL